MSATKPTTDLDRRTKVIAWSSGSSGVVVGRIKCAQLPERASLFHTSAFWGEPFWSTASMGRVEVRAWTDPLADLRDGLADGPAVELRERCLRRIHGVIERLSKRPRDRGAKSINKKSRCFRKHA